MPAKTVFRTCWSAGSGLLAQICLGIRVRIGPMIVVPPYV